MPYYKIAQATLRCTATAVGAVAYNHGYAIPSNTKIRTPSLTVTASRWNAATCFLYEPLIEGGSSTFRGGQTFRVRYMIPLTAGQSFTFTGLPLGGAGYNDMSFGTGYLYFTATTTAARAIVTYYKQD